jgi:hypothetical protein
MLCWAWCHTGTMMRTPLPPPSTYPIGDACGELSPGTACSLGMSICVCADITLLTVCVRADSTSRQLHVQLCLCLQYVDSTFMYLAVLQGRL